MAGEQAEGWYRDPNGGPDQRWWSGSAWTDATRRSSRLDGTQHAEVVHLLEQVRTGIVVLAGLVVLFLLYVAIFGVKIR